MRTSGRILLIGACLGTAWPTSAIQHRTPLVPTLPVPALSQAPAAAAPNAATPRNLAAMSGAVEEAAAAIDAQSGAESDSSAAAAIAGAITGETPASAVAADLASEQTQDEAEIAQMRPLVLQMEEQYSKVVVGQAEMGRAMRLALFAGGHVLAEGLPGTAKTRSVKALAAMTGLTSSRIQFTRDLQPFDITGQEEKNRKTEEWEIRRGPVFKNIVLADEINRAKSQAQGALLQPMEEGHVTIAGQTLAVPQPFLVLATQNPIEDDGTYPLPRAQLDRFMFKVKAPYLGENEVARMLTLVMNEDETPITIEQVLSEAQVVRIRQLVRRVTVSAEIRGYIERLLLATRPENSALPMVKKYVRYGASDRSAVTLMKAARAYAFEQGRAAVLPEDVRAVAHWVLDHRVILSYEGEGETTAEAIIGQVLTVVPPITAKK